MTDKQLKEGNNLNGQDKYITRLFDTLQNDVDFTINLEDGYRRRIADVMTSIKSEIHERFEKL